MKLDTKKLYEHGVRVGLNYEDPNLIFTAIPLIIKEDGSFLSTTDKLDNLNENEKIQIAKSFCTMVLNELASDFKCSDVNFTLSPRVYKKESKVGNFYYEDAVLSDENKLIMMENNNRK